MKWLKMERKEKRTKSLSIRLSQTSVEKLDKITGYLEKKYSSVSQADAIEHFINVAYEELPRQKK